jgi:hypothetical protein
MMPAGLLKVLDAVTGRHLRSIGLPGPAHVRQVAPHPDGRTAWVAAGGIRVFDRQTFSMIGAAPMAEEPQPQFVFAEKWEGVVLRRGRRSGQTGRVPSCRVLMRE